MAYLSTKRGEHFGIGAHLLISEPRWLRCCSRINQERYNLVVAAACGSGRRIAPAIERPPQGRSPKRSSLTPTSAVRSPSGVVRPPRSLLQEEINHSGSAILAGPVEA